MPARSRPARRSVASSAPAAADRNRGHRDSPLVPYLRRHIAAAHALLKPPLAELSIALVGDRRMTELHKQFLGVAGTTDVLTFPLETDRRGRPLAGGEVVVCIPEARRRAGAGGEPGSGAVSSLLYALHGLLHLCGFDDRTRSGFAAMHRTEDAILTTLDIGPVFSSAGRPVPKQQAARDDEVAARSKSRRARSAPGKRPGKRTAKRVRPRAAPSRES